MSPEEAAASTKIKSILTDDQRSKVGPLMQDIRAAGPAGLPLPALAKIDLSKDQWSKLHAILTKSRKALEPGEDMDEMREQRQKVHEKIGRAHV